MVQYIKDLVSESIHMKLEDQICMGHGILHETCPQARQGRRCNVLLTASN